MTAYNPKNERVRTACFQYQREARGKAHGTIDAVRKAIDRYEDYTGHRDFSSFNKDQASAFKRHLAKQRLSSERRSNGWVNGAGDDERISGVLPLA